MSTQDASVLQEKVQEHLRCEYLDINRAGMSVPATIVKRDGRVVPFDIHRIERAMSRCFANLGKSSRVEIPELARRVVNIIAAKANGTLPTVEGVQDIVEMVLQAAGEFDAAKHYILYRAEHARKREERPIPKEVRRSFAESSPYFPTPLQKFQFFDKYSRFNYDLGRRETWMETITRSTEFLRELSGNALPPETYERIFRAMLDMRVMPSMRLLAMAGAAARRNNVSIYNCSYQPVESIDSFVEALIISMSGCGVGFSVESRYVENFPRVKRQRGEKPDTFVVGDSAEGWAEALRLGLERWFEGGDIRFDLSQLRPAGSPLRTKGGRASGPEPLRVMLKFLRSRILSRQGSFLRPIDAHDMMCAVGNAAVSGGVRRTALISLFDYDDIEMRQCKNGDFERDNSQRWNANNSVVWPEGGLTQLEFIQTFMEMVESGRGEPGIFNREAALAMRPARRAAAEFGTNPCGEVVLRPWQFCNLSSAIARVDDTLETLRDKVELATIIGTIQSMATHFPGLRPQWKRNCEEERLLGVDITGQMDSPVAQDALVKEQLRHDAVEANQQVARMLGIAPSVALTCVKPSGNSSQLVDCSSGLHARWSPFYTRNVRVATHSPLFKVLRDAGVPMDPENGQTPEDANTWVVHFPVKAPDGAITRNDRSAIEQCEYWLQNKLYWTEHNPSCFTGETRIVTDRGLMSFHQIEDLATGEDAAPPRVLGKDGQWVTAAFRSLGEQDVWELVVERGGIQQTLRTTANHLWPITSPMRRFRGRDTELRTTRDLPVGSKASKLLTVNPREEGWKVVSVRNTGTREAVYCMEVQGAEPYFTLEGNILTHNCTITYRPDEVIEVMKWVWEHRDKLGGITFLPAFDANYAQMPYVEMNQTEYERLAAAFPDIDFSKIYRYEDKDLTTLAQELACFSGTCETDRL